MTDPTKPVPAAEAEVVSKQPVRPVSRLGNVLYNLDRAVASAFGAPAQETISSEVGLVKRGQAWGHYRFEARIAIWIADWLDTGTRLWGPNHTERAIEHATRLDAADDGREQ